MTMKKKLRVLALAGALALTLSGCSAVRYLLTGDWNGDADLVVVNQSRAVLASITLSTEDGSRTLEDGRGFALLERGESYGLSLDKGEEDCTIALLDIDGYEVGRARLRFTGERLYLTVWEGGGVTVMGQED